MVWEGWLATVLVQYGIPAEMAAAAVDRLHPVAVAVAGVPDRMETGLLVEQRPLRLQVEEEAEVRTVVREV